LQPDFNFFSLHRSQPESSASGSRGRRELIGLIVLSREDDCTDSATFCVLLAGSILAAFELSYIVHGHDVNDTHRADLRYAHSTDCSQVCSLDRHLLAAAKLDD
jgi:hypothetical protein